MERSLERANDDGTFLKEENEQLMSELMTLKQDLQKSLKRSALLPGLDLIQIIMSVSF